MKLTDAQNKRITESAKGEVCTINLAGTCRHDSETTVYCHLPDESHGMGKKSFVLSGCYGCFSCHQRIDGRVNYQWEAGEKDFYLRRAQTRTLKRLIEKGILFVK